MRDTLVACPRCSASLKLKSPAKKARCPKCSAVFSLPATPEALAAAVRTKPSGAEPAAADAEGRPETASDHDDPAHVTPDQTRADCYRTVDSTEQVVGSPLRPPQLADELGRLGPYRVLKLLGQGGMGMVYEAEDVRLKRHIALKVMRPEHAVNARARQRFLREAQTQAAIEHDHIVTIHQADEDAGVPFIAMPLLKGETLSDDLKRAGRLPLADILRIGREAAEGLSAAHERGLIHRDIKPSNLWLEGKRRRVKILDFGLARAVEAVDDPHLTGSGVAIGTPAYMAPEQARGETVDARSDLFSLGCVLYQMTTGTLPFQGSTMMAFFNALATTTPKPAREIVPDLPAGLSELIERLLAKDPQGRPTDAQAVSDTLAAVERSLAPMTMLNIPAHTILPRGEAADSAGTAPRDPPPATDPAFTPPPPSNSPTPRAERPAGAAVAPAKPRRLAPIVAIAIAAALLLVCGGGGTMLYQVIIVRDKEGNKIAEIVVPKGGTVEIGKDGKKIVIPFVEPKVDPLKASGTWQPIPVGQSPLDKLDASAIPKAERFAWQPKELVAVIGKHEGRRWSQNYGAAVSPDGTLAATSDGLDTVIWDFKTQTPKMVVPMGGCRSLEFTADGKRLFCGAEKLEMWDISGKEPMRAPLGASAKAEPLSTGRDNVLAVLVEDRKSVCFGDSTTLNVGNLRGPTPVITVKATAVAGQGWAVASKSSQVFYVSKDKKVLRATIKNGRLENEEALPIPWSENAELHAVTRDGKELVVWVGKETQVWDLSDRAPKVTHRIPEPPVRQSSRTPISSDGKWLAAKYNHAALFRLDAPEPKFVAWLDQTDRAGAHGSIAFSPDGQKAIVCNYNGLVRFWDLSAPEPRELSPFDPAATFDANPPGRSYPFDPVSGTLLLSRFDVQNGHNCRVQQWDLAGQRPNPGPLLDGDAFGAFFSHGKNRWVQIGQFQGAKSRHYRLTDGEIQQVGEKFGSDNFGGAASPDGGTVIIYSLDGPTRLEAWDLTGETPKLKWSVTPKDHAPFVGNYGGQVWFSGDNRWFATQGKPDKDGDPWKLVVWRNTTKPEVHAILPIPLQPNLYRGAFSPDGRYLAHTPTNFSEIVVVDLRGKAPREAGKFNDTAQVSVCGSLAFHPECKRLAVGSNAGICILDVPDLKVTWDWRSPGPVAWLDWSADGRHLVTHNANMTLYVLRFPESISGKTAAVLTDRQVAERVIRKGGVVNFLSKLPLPEGEFQINRIELPHNKLIEDSDLSHIGALKSLEQLDLLNCPGVTDAGIRHLANCKSLRVVRVTASSTTPHCIKTIVKLPELFQLHCPLGMTNEAMAELSPLKKLVSLQAEKSAITDDGLDVLAQLPALRGVSFPYAKGITDRGATKLAKVKHLEAIRLYDSPVTAAGWREIARLPNLKAVQAADAYPEEMLRILASVPTLQRIDGYRDGSHLELFKNHPSLTEVYLTSPKVDDNTIQIIGTLKNLRSLSIKGSKIAPAGFEKLKAALPNCRIESDHGTFEPK